MIGGFSEPPVTVMVVGAGLGFVYTWFFVKSKMRRTLLYPYSICLCRGSFCADCDGSLSCRSKPWQEHTALC